MHREFAKLCLKAKCYQHSIPVIEIPITSFKKQCNPMDIIVYNYYRGLLFTGLNRFKEAIDCFKLAISQPSQITHKVFSESYKKLSILSLLVSGKLA